MVLKAKKYPKIIQLGFHKCGTSSLSHFLNASNIKTCHWEKGEIAKSFFSRMKKNFMIYHINENHPRDLCNFLKNDFDGLSLQNYEIRNTTV